MQAERTDTHLCTSLADQEVVQLSVRVDDLLHKVGLLTAPYTQVPPAFLQKSAASHARSLAAVLKRWYQARQIDYRRYLQRHPPTNSLNLREEILAGAARHLTSLSSLNELRTHQYLPRQPALSKEELLQPWLALASAVDPAFPPEVRSLAKATQSKSTLSGLNLSDSTENELGTEMHREMESAFGAAYDDAAVALGAGISYSITPEEALKWLDAYTLHFKDAETKGLEAQAKLLVLEGVQAGEGASQIMDKLTSLFDSLKDFKAERVARTETSRMYAQGSLSAYKDLGYETVTRNEIIDGRTDRDLCEPFDGAVYYLESAMIGRAGDYPEAIPAHPSCLVSPGTPVYTADGWKAIFKVAVGDLVLTHRGRFRRVTKLHRQGVAVREVVELALLPFATIPEGESRRLVVTPEHPVLTSYGWKVAGEIVSGDKVRTLSVPCAGCGKPLPLMIEKGTKRYCSPQCQWKDPECRESTIRGIRKSLHQQYKDGVRVGSEITKAAHRKMHELALEGKHPFQLQDLTGERNPAKRPEVRKVISEGKRGARNPMHRSKHDDAYWKAVSERWQKHFAQHPEKHINSILAKRRWDGGMTWIETLMGRALEAAGISAEFSYRVGSRWLDWAIPEAQIDIECDGERWHSTKEQLAKDAARDLELQVQGWTVLRFPGVRIRKDAAGCVDAVGRLLANHAKCYSFGDFEVREVQRRTGKYATYNLAVEEDESYCAKIFVVHNCRGWWSGGGDESQAINLGQVSVSTDIVEPTVTAPEDVSTATFTSAKDMSESGVNTLLRLGNGVATAVKPAEGEFPSDMRKGIASGTQYQREVAASVIDEAMGLNLVPKTVVRDCEDLGVDIGFTGKASVQTWIEGAVTPFEASELLDIPVREVLSQLEESLQEKLALFDVMLWNTDRHSGNLLVKLSGDGIDSSVLHLIDHGLTLPNTMDAGLLVQEVSETLFGTELSSDSLAALERLTAHAEEVTAELAEIGLHYPVNGFWARVEMLLDLKRFPTLEEWNAL